MKYSAGLISQSFWFVETKKTSQYLINNYNKDEIKELIVSKNIYQVKQEYRCSRIFNYIYNRSKELPKCLVQMLPTCDIDTAKIIVLISIMKTDKLFFEFMYEVFRNKLILGDLKIEDRDMNLFFDEKINQSETVSKWTNTSIAKLKRTYIKMLVDAGLMVINEKKKTVLPPMLNYNLISLLRNNDLDVFANALTGEN